VRLPIWCLARFSFKKRKLFGASSGGKSNPLDWRATTIQSVKVASPSAIVEPVGDVFAVEAKTILPRLLHALFRISQTFPCWKIFTHHLWWISKAGFPMASCKKGQKSIETLVTLVWDWTRPDRALLVVLVRAPPFFFEIAPKELRTSTWQPCVRAQQPKKPMPLEGLQVKATPEQDIVNNTCVPAKYTPRKSQRVTQQSQTNTIKKHPKAAFPLKFPSP